MTIELLTNGELIKTVTLNKSNNWQHTFTNLDKYNEAIPINYSIFELDIDDNYISTIDGFTITNTHITSTTSVHVVKVWDDNHNSDGKRPKNITIQLYANNNPYGDPVVLGEHHTWEYTYENLPKYNNSKLISYTIQEVPVTDYTSTVTKVSNNIIITNT